MDIILNYEPQDDFEASDKAYMIRAYELFKEKLYFRQEFFHFTASGIVFNQTMTKVLLIYHKIYDSWGWMGGHMDGEIDFNYVALKEIKEESGLKNVDFISKAPVSIEILPVWMHHKNGGVISSHQHFNVSFAFMADENESLEVNSLETNGVKWVDISDIDKVVREVDMLPIYHKIINRVFK